MVKSKKLSNSIRNKNSILGSIIELENDPNKPLENDDNITDKIKMASEIKKRDSIGSN